MTDDNPPTSRLPYNQLPLLRSVIGHRLLDVERSLTPLAAHLEYGEDSAEYLSAASGPTELTFSGNLRHTLISWPSQLSVYISSERLPDDEYAERHLLSQSRELAPSWLSATLGAMVLSIRVYEFIDDIDSSEARQAAIGYLLDTKLELMYCTQLHGRMTADELVRRSDLPAQLPARWIGLDADRKPPA